MNDRFKFRVPVFDEGKFLCFHFFNAIDGADHYREIGPYAHGKEEQCTGMKDKNGRLTYEGDIVKATFKYMGSNTENLCFAVAFSDGAFGYFDELGRFGLLANFGTGVMFNVVGNIHENPELLEDK